MGDVCVCVLGYVAGARTGLSPRLSRGWGGEEPKGSLGQVEGKSASVVSVSRVAYSRGALPVSSTPIFQMLSDCQNKHLLNIYYVWALFVLL